MEDNNLIPEQEHGFIPGRSVVIGLLFSTNTWTKTMDSKQPLDIIYLDFSKAFNKVPYDLLLIKLKSAALMDPYFVGSEHSWRIVHFVLRVGKVTSSLRSVVSGVPQGSVLGPILFLLYTCDLLRSIENCYSAYADDIKIFGYPQKTDLQAKLNIVTEWSKKWQIPLNTSKCCVLHCGINNPKLVYFINGSELLVKKSHNDLGVIVTDTLSWSEQCLAAAGRTRRVLYLLKHVFDNPSPDLVLLFLYGDQT
jgi:ribonuclease P/MRP protein subunit RPP40